jgi:hypothetical protein
VQAVPLVAGGWVQTPALHTSLVHALLSLAQVTVPVRGDHPIGLESWQL